MQVAVLKNPKEVPKVVSKNQKKKIQWATEQQVAEQHGFPWQPGQGEIRHSVQEACLGKKPPPKRLQMEKYLEAILGEKP